MRQVEAGWLIERLAMRLAGLSMRPSKLAVRQSRPMERHDVLATRLPGPSKRLAAS